VNAGREGHENARQHTLAQAALGRVPYVGSREHPAGRYPDAPFGRARARRVLVAVFRFVRWAWLLLCATATLWFVLRLVHVVEPAVKLSSYGALPVVGVPIPVPGPGCVQAEGGGQ
jgi:hypothetical protein